MNVVKTGYVGQYAEWVIGYDLLSTNEEQGYHTIRCYGVLNVTGYNWSAYNIHAKVVDQDNYYDYGSYGSGYNYLVSKDVNVYATDEGKCTYSFGGQITSGFQSSDWISGTITLPDIPRASVPTIGSQTTNQPDFNIGTTIRIYTNRKSTSFTNEIYFDYGGSSVKIADDITDYYDFDTTSVANALYALIPNDNEYAGTISVKTYKDTTQIGTTKTCNYIAHIVNANPTFSNFTFADTNSTTTTLTGNNQYCITNYSNIKVTISTSNKAVAQKGATMSKYRFVCGNKSVDIAYSSSASVNGTINSVPNGIYQVYAIDSRGNSTLVTKQATSIIQYTELVRTTNPSSKRNTGVGEEYTLQYAGTLWSGNFGSVSNTITSATYKYKKTTSSTWINGTTNIMPTISSSTFSFSGLIKGDTNAGFDINYSYDIEITVQDRLSTTKYTVVLISGKPNLAIDEDGVSIGAKYDTTLSGALQVYGDINYIDSNDVATNVMSLINQINNSKISFTELWTNSDPTVIFNEQPITLSSNDYNYLVFLYYNINSGNFRGISSTIVPKGEDALLSSMYFNDSTTVNVYMLRKATYDSDTQYSISKGWFTSTDVPGSARDFNVFIVPYKVIGIK